MEPETPGPELPRKKTRRCHYRTWPELRARTFAIDALACPVCQGRPESRLCFTYAPLRGERQARPADLRPRGIPAPIVEGITIGLQVLLVFIGTLTRGIGGVGVANIMLVSVDERVREIGLRRALGARRRHIKLQFLAEALVLTLAGGAVGMALAWAIVTAMPVLPLLGPLFEDTSGKGDLRLHISALTVLGSTVILVAVGVLSGLVPAVKASRLDPSRPFGTSGPRAEASVAGLGDDSRKRVSAPTPKWGSWRSVRRRPGSSWTFALPSN